MKSRLFLTIISLVLCALLLVPFAFSFFEYAGDLLLSFNVDGRINQNAFDVLNSDDYRADQYGYGTTPENPFVINNLDRLGNLIRLNNTGRLDASKIKDGTYQIGQYYFVLNFTEEELPQVLDLAGIPIESVGNNDHPFTDVLSGLIYAYCYDETDKKYVYLSGLAEVDITIEGESVYIDGVETTITAGSVAAGKYVKVPNYYVQEFEIAQGDKIEVGSNNSIYVPVSILRPIHNVIANAVVVVPEAQIDVGFFSQIGTNTVTLQGDTEPTTLRGGVHDFILYNTTIISKDTTLQSIWTAIQGVWASLFGDHNKQDEYAGDDTGYHERHIGIFAGHIDGDVSNITVAGEGVIEINADNVNHYSRFTTVGYIHPDARIGSKLFSEIIGEGIGAIQDTGFLFADSIYAVADDDVSTQYQLKDIPASGVWSGVETDNTSGLNFFKHGAFRFVLSQEIDLVRKIWSGNGEYNLLNEEGYIATRSVLYSNDEYRYSSSTQEGGSLITSAASANETRYQGAHALVASGSSLDKGKYVIAAKVPDGDGGFDYYALKIVAEVVNNEIVYVFDTSDKIEITDYINGVVDNIYSSAVWQTMADSSTPVFRNDRFSVNYLSVAQSDDTYTKELTKTREEAAEFSYSINTSSFYYRTEVENPDGGLSDVYYYLSFDTAQGFYFSTEKTTEIEVFRLSNGFRLELVTNAPAVEANEDYVIVARQSGKHYMLGEEVEENIEDGVTIAKGTFALDYVFDTMPTMWTLQEYQDFRKYIWYTPTASDPGGTAAFHDKMSGMYYLSVTDGALAMSSQQSSWTYTQSSGEGGTLRTDNSYLNFAVPAPSASGTGFSVASSSYTIYLYKLVPEDDVSSYNTYQGASLITSESSSVESGQYLIAVDTGTSYIGLTMSGAGTLGTTDLTSYINGIGANALAPDTGSLAGYKWRVDSTSNKPALRNVGYGQYLSEASNTLSASATAHGWMYDATSGRVYYTVASGSGESITYTPYYLAYASGSFVITTNPHESGFNYNIRLYKLTYEYVYSGVVPVQSISEADTVFGNATKTYFITTSKLSEMTTKSTFVLGALGTEDESAVTSVNISGNSSFSGTTLTTTTDLSFYGWYLEPRVFSGFPSDIYAQNPTGSYFPAFQFKNGMTGMYLAASSAANSRTLVVATTPNMNKSPASGSSQAENNDGAMTAIGFGQKRSGGTTANGRIYNNTGSVTDGTSSIYVMGRTANYEYYIWNTETPGVFAITTYSARPANTTRPFLYEASSMDINIYIYPLSEKGDNLDPNIHYMITARVEDGADREQYYALSEVEDEEGVKQFKGINVTSQAQTINDSVIEDEQGNIIEYSSTDTLRMVPVESDWFQISDEKGLVFYHSFYSTNAVKEYLDVTSGALPSPAFTPIPVASAQEPAKWYYDSISKYFKYYRTESIAGGVVEVSYYLTYNPGTDTFGFTNNIASATHFYIYRFKPTYVVTEITDSSSESLKSGNFVIAHKSGDNYTAIGVNTTDVIAKDVTKYLTSNTGSVIGTRDDLSETEYNEILEYIFRQQHYDFSGETYGSTVYMQLFSQVTGGGFTVNQYAPGLQTGSDPMVWTLNRSGTQWRFRNRYALTGVTAGSRYINAHDLRSYLRISDAIPTYFNTMAQRQIQGTARLYTYTANNRSLNLQTGTISDGTEYYVVWEGEAGNYYIIYFDNGSFAVDSLSATPSGNNLILSSAPGNAYVLIGERQGWFFNYTYHLKSKNTPTRYLTYSSGSFGASTNRASNWANSSSGLTYGGTSVTPIVYLDSYQFNSSTTGSDVFLYKFNGSNYTAVNDGLDAGSDYAMVVNVGGTYYIVGYSGKDLTRTSLGTSKPASLTTSQVTASRRLTAKESITGVSLGFESAGLYFTLTPENTFVLITSSTTALRYSANRLYTVNSIPFQYIRTTGSTISWQGTTDLTYSSAIPQAWLYEATPRSGGYDLTRLESTEPITGKEVVIILHYSTGYRAINRNGTAINLADVNLNGNNITANMVWHYDGDAFYYTSGGQTRYLRRTSSGLTTGDDKDIDFFRANYVTYGFGSGSSANSTYLSIFRIDQSSEIDEVTDLDSMLSSKAKLTPTISLLESNNYIIVAEIDTDRQGSPDKFYSFGMIDPSNTQAIDITEMIKRANTGKDVTLFDATVWEQRGSDLSLIFDNIGFRAKTEEENPFYLLSGVSANRGGMEPAVIKNETFPGDYIGDYIWRTYSYEDGSYLFGFTEDEVVYFLYFDLTHLKFRLTTNRLTAHSGSGIVQLYQLGNKTANQPDFKTPIITVDNTEVITSYPLNKAEALEDLIQYIPGNDQSGEDMEQNGEYLIIAKSGIHYYALSLDENSVLTYIDVSPYYSGNYSYDDNDNLCLAINNAYIWRQIAEIIPDSPTQSMVFENLKWGAMLGGGSGYNYDFDTSQLYKTVSGSPEYLRFSVSSGFSYGSAPSDTEIFLYQLGAAGIDTGDEGTLNFTYYSTPLSVDATSGIDFSRFSFTKTHIPDLLNFSVGANNNIEKSVGWNLDSTGTKLTEITSSVFFAKGISLDTSDDDPAAGFADQFASLSSPFAVIDPITGDTRVGDYSYFAPTGTGTLLINEASTINPVFVNVIVSTEFDNANLDADKLRFLSLWKVANLDSEAESVTALKTYQSSNGKSAIDFAYTLSQKLFTPDYAIPLPNTYGTQASGASYARVDGVDYTLSENNYPEALIAHTFVITDPGLYYMGTTYGSIAISYISIDNMAEGESDSGISAGSQMTIDFAHGAIDLDDSFSFAADASDELLAGLSYVGSDSWYHSNIFPMFTQGDEDNPVDNLLIKTLRLDLGDDSSIVEVRAYTKQRLAKDIQYANNNTLPQRVYRKVDFKVFVEGLDTQIYTAGAAAFFTASKSEVDNTFRFYTHKIIDGEDFIFTLNVDTVFDEDLSEEVVVSMLSAVGSHFWSFDSGSIKSEDGMYLVYADDKLQLSEVATNALKVYTLEAGSLTSANTLINGKTYLFLTEDTSRVIILTDD